MSVKPHLLHENARCPAPAYSLPWPPCLGLFQGTLPWQQPPYEKLSCLEMLGFRVSFEPHLCFSAQASNFWSENSSGLGWKIALLWPCFGQVAVPRRLSCWKVTSLHGTAGGLAVGLGLRIWLHLCRNFPDVAVLFRAFWMLMNWARSPCCTHWFRRQVWSKPSEGTGDVCSKRTMLIPVTLYSLCYCAGSCIGQEFEDTGGPRPGEALGTCASVLWSSRRYLKSTTLLLECTQLCCFGLVPTRSAVSSVLPLQTWFWASTDLCLSEYLWH